MVDECEGLLGKTLKQLWNKRHHTCHVLSFMYVPGRIIIFIINLTLEPSVHPIWCNSGCRYFTKECHDTLMISWSRGLFLVLPRGTPRVFDLLCQALRHDIILNKTLPYWRRRFPAYRRAFVAVTNPTKMCLLLLVVALTCLVEVSVAVALSTVSN